MVSGEQTVGILKYNTCNENYPSGIVFEDGASGEAVANKCENNPWSGIACRDEGTKPLISADQCCRNGAWGIIYWAGAEPEIAQDNIFAENYRGDLKARP